MIFGRGTKLTVQPDKRDSLPPSVFLLTSKNVPSTSCLAKDFYPENVEIYMNSNMSESSDVKVNSVLTREGLYNAVLVQNTQSTECRVKHQGKWVTSQKNSRAGEPKIQTTGIQIISTYDENCIEQPSTVTDTNINILTVTVLGMRVLLVKALVFNVLLSVKLIYL